MIDLNIQNTFSRCSALTRLWIHGVERKEASLRNFRLAAIVASRFVTLFPAQASVDIIVSETYQKNQDSTKQRMYAAYATATKLYRYLR
jgi:hypothetical protein